MTSPQKTPPNLGDKSRDDPTNPVPEAEGGGELIERVAEAIRRCMGYCENPCGEAGCECLTDARYAARAALSALSSEAPPVVCGGEDGSARADVAEPGSQERAAVVPAAERDLAYAQSLAIAAARHYGPPPGFTVLDDMYGVLMQIDNALTGLSRTPPPDHDAIPSAEGGSARSHPYADAQERSHDAQHEDGKKG